MIRKITFILCLFVFYSCGSRDEKLKVPDNIIQPQEMVSILVDFHLIEASLSLSQDKREDVNQTSNFRYRSVMEKHKITRAKFDESIRYYSGHMKEMHKIYQQVVVELSTTQSRIISK